MRTPRLLYTLVLLACAPLAAQELRLTRVASGLVNPVDIQDARDGSGRLFVVQQNGVIRILRNGTLESEPFLDIRSRTQVSGECGLLGLAFPPQFRERRRFYVNYTDRACRNSFLARYRVDRDADTVNPDSEEILIAQPQPFPNHNGGGLQFGPDGFLYAGFGDGGSGGDPQNNGQNTGTLLGKMLRIDTESAATGYQVPPSNPFTGDARYKPEIWALGLRNPWRFSFDRETGDLWIADVGQNRAEEVNFQSSLSRGGENYGWRLMEGMACFNPSNCDRTGLTLPVHEYTRERGDVSVTGGYVYRGAAWPSLRGTYIYGDYATGRIWGIRREGPLFNNRLLVESRLNISSLGEDAAGEVYVADHNGAVYRLEGADVPQLSSRSVTDAASFDINLVPGSAAVAFAGGITSGPGITAATSLPLPRVLAGVRVTVNGRDAPLYAVANSGTQEQVNFQVPFETETGSGRVAVIRDGRSSATVEVPVLEARAGIFLLDGDALLVRLAGNTLVTRQSPLRRGEVVYFYVTGLGAVDNNPGTGNATPASPLATARESIAVTIDGQPCEVLWAGLAPGFAGVYQVNLRTAAGIGGGLKEMVVTVRNQASRAARVPVE